MTDFNDMPEEILCNIISYLKITYEKIITREKEQELDKIKERQYVITHISFKPTPLCLINKKWYKSILQIKCKYCKFGNYNTFKNLYKCNNCGYIAKQTKKMYISNIPKIEKYITPK